MDIDNIEPFGQLERFIEWIIFARFTREEMILEHRLQVGELLNLLDHVIKESVALVEQSLYGIKESLMAPVITLIHQLA